MIRTPYGYVPGLSETYRGIRRFARRYWYAGDSVRCPVCRRAHSTWLHHPRCGTCPYCLSGARHRALWLYLDEEWEQRPGAVEVLHLAPEWCLQRRFRADPRVARYVTADLAAPEADVRTDVQDMVFESHSFDCVVSVHLLEHVPDDRAAIGEIFRVLRPGGVAYILVPFSRERPETDEDPSVVDPWERRRRFGQFDHVREYGADVGDRLRRGGFLVSEVRPDDFLGPDEIGRSGLWEGEVIFRCEAIGT